MKIAVVGAGISGVVAALKLYRRHDVTVFEASDNPGGHAHTVDVDLSGRTYAIDTGFIVFNDRTYPNFLKLLDEFGVRYYPTSMSFSVRNDRNGWEYCGSNLFGLFAQKRNLVRPQFWRMLGDVLRFNREARGPIAGSELAVGEFLSRARYSDAFSENYLLAMGAAIWSCSPGRFAEFPIRFVARFFEHHGLLDLRNRPQWYTIRGGSRNYVEAFTAGFRNRIRLRTPVRAVTRNERDVEIVTAGGERESFDHVVFACHSDQALRMLTDADARERNVLSGFSYEKNAVVLHTDARLLPRRKSAWAAWNYHLTTAESDRATVTYNMNVLQGIEAPETVCVTLNEEERIAPDRVLGRFEYAHPVFSTERDRMQRRHRELINRRNSSFCGAYWGNGFHEDGVNSALAVCEVLTRLREPCTVASM